VGALPIVEVHLVEGRHTAAQHAQLLRVISVRDAEILDAPLDRVRAYLTLHRPAHRATDGEPVAAVSAPYLTAIVLEGRPAEQRRRRSPTCWSTCSAWTAGWSAAGSSRCIPTTGRSAATRWTWSG
jgi:phenylpyruvate tautomerase PptA (4-oxalocrotonate tautomerase family)